MKNYFLDNVAVRLYNGVFAGKEGRKIETDDETELIRAAMSAIGKRKSERKTAAVRENGKKGGRPPGTPQSAETKAKLAAAQTERRAREKAARPPAEKKPVGRPPKKQKEVTNED